MEEGRRQSSPGISTGILYVKEVLAHFLYSKLLYNMLNDSRLFGHTVRKDNMGTSLNIRLL